MRPYAIFVHGFNVRDDGKNTVDTLKPAVSHFHNIRAMDYDYGWLGLFGVRFLNWRLAKTLGGLVQEQDILVAHSNGCVLVHEALKRSERRCKLAFLIAPALDRDVEFPKDKFENVVILHTKHDIPVRLSKYIPFHPWGEMGAYGAKASNVKNIDCSGWVKGHSHYFAPENQPKTRAILASEIRNAYASLHASAAGTTSSGLRDPTG